MQGLGNNTADYKGLTLALREAYGIPSVVAKVSRFDWFRNAAGLLSPKYWRGTLCPRPVLDWYVLCAIPNSGLGPSFYVFHWRLALVLDRYLERVDEAVTEASELLADGESKLQFDGFGVIL